MTAQAQLRWTSAARTDIGLVRSRNEDALLEMGERGVWAVADGMGGHAYGDVASGMVVEALQALADPGDIDRFAAAAGDQLRAVNRRLRDEAVLRKVAMMGSTVVVLLASGSEAAYVWAGDSRIYLYRNGRLRQLTRDHSQAEEYRAHPPGLDAPPAMPNQITRALGAADTIDYEVGTLQVRDGDLFLLCSDGLSNPVEDQAIAEMLAAGDCRRAVDELVAQALANGGRDNISVVVVRADDASSDKTMINPAL
ncbi:protein phosphatase 2C domain-containing protein [Massilia sp. R2A-15]|uniref:PP2C family protein-serine/threonine phosphatase n=1 Tax=Massilia sp. R2A-15 TaxID=3064278 RepID=UPI0027349CE1|nr:protein phosphatase 2C domain-containing protein [Massilia sp. R2A-15]WLI88807.1 protein phosphatase 2C domain-containing protein [Massilia sp. R2A-15]